jgi:hypothetical protein
MSNYLSLHPSYFLKEGFGTLMSHYAVMYSLYKDVNITPVIVNIDFQSRHQISAMKFFNNFNQPIIDHHQAFKNFKDIFLLLNEQEVSKYNWSTQNWGHMQYDDIVNHLKKQTQNISCIWSLSSHMYDKYLNEIINMLYVFNDSIIESAKNILPKTDKNIIAICVRNEYKKINCPHVKLSLNFYIESMKQFDTNNSQYLIFSDDIEESKTIFKPLEQSFDIVYTDLIQSAIGMCAMSMCDHIICANSSFSYWASLLNTKPSKKIVCSTKFIDPQINSQLAESLNYKWYPDNWYAIDIC